jgi:ATP-dependent protease HslVU (ClpYQ) peptidase subunit
MSTIVVAKKAGRAAIGADTLTQLGFAKLGGTRESAAYVANHSKVIRVGESYLAAVGQASWPLVLSSYFAGLAEPPRLESVQAIFEAARELHRALKEDYFLNPNADQDDEFESSQLECLIANRGGIFGLYSLRSVSEYTRFYAFGNGYGYALGAMHAVYDTADSAEEVVRAGLAAAAEFDYATGLPMEVHSVELGSRS